VRLIEGRIALDLKTNMNSIRFSVEKRELDRRGSRDGAAADENNQMIGLTSNSSIDTIGVDNVSDALATSSSSSSSSSSDIYVTDAVTSLLTPSTEVSIAPSSPSSADEEVIQSPTTVISVLWLKQELKRVQEENEALRCRIHVLESEVSGYNSLRQSLKELIKD
jgi:hypothetical protein